MRYTTVPVGLIPGHETDNINEAIAQGCSELSAEINGPVELVSVVSVPTPRVLCLVVMAKPYEPLRLHRAAPETFIERFAKH